MTSILWLIVGEANILSVDYNPINNNEMNDNYWYSMEIYHLFILRVINQCSACVNENTGHLLVVLSVKVLWKLPYYEQYLFLYKIFVQCLHSYVKENQNWSVLDKNWQMRNFPISIFKTDLSLSIHQARI